MVIQAINGRAPTQDEDAINLHIGKRLRRRRRLLGLTQGLVGAALKVHFQQVQKYECAANKMSAARLFTLAKALEVPVQYFYEGLAPNPANDSGNRAKADPLDLPETRELLEAYYALTPHARQRLLALVKALFEVNAQPD